MGINKKALAAIAILILGGAAIAALIVYTRRGWKEVPSSSGWCEWHRGSVSHLDRNGDGVVDEEIDDQGRADDYLVKEDTDFDGWLDKSYHLGISGIPDSVRKIRQKAPRH